MDFPERLNSLRKEQGFTQQPLADSVGVYVNRIRGYEREPREELKHQFEALSQFDEEEIKIVKALLESLILKHNAKRAFAEDLKRA